MFPNANSTGPEQADQGLCCFHGCMPLLFAQVLSPLFMSYDSYKISQEPGKATFWTNGLKQNKIIFPYVDHLKEPHLYGTNSKAEHSMVNICLLFQKGDHYWRKDMTFLTYESLPHTCHKLWTKICEIRQNFKGDLTKFCEIFLNITLELPQYSLKSSFFFFFFFFFM